MKLCLLPVEFGCLGLWWYVLFKCCIYTIIVLWWPGKFLEINIKGKLCTPNRKNPAQVIQPGHWLWTQLTTWTLIEIFILYTLKITYTKGPLDPWENIRITITIFQQDSPWYLLDFQHHHFCGCFIRFSSCPNFLY